MYSDDPLKDFAAWDAEQQKLLDRLPVCADCGEPVQDGYYFRINDEVICPDCIDSYRVDVGDIYEDS